MRVLKYLWAVKSLFLLPFDVGSDGLMASTHYENGDLSWFCLTVALMILPYVYRLNPISDITHFLTEIEYAIARLRFDFGINCCRNIQYAIARSKSKCRKNTRGMSILS